LVVLVNGTGTTFQGGGHDRGFRLKFLVLRTLWTAFLWVRPGSSLAHFHLGNAFAAQGRRKPAIEHWKAAGALDARQWKAQKNLASALLAEGQSQTALEVLVQVSRERPGDLSVALLLARAQEAAGVPEQALSTLLRCVAMAPDSAEVLAQIGLIYLKRGEAARAIEWLQRAQAADRHGSAYERALKLARARLGAPGD
jgi:tetratricopeptide (TPR) repeat protein